MTDRRRVPHRVVAVAAVVPLLVTTACTGSDDDSGDGGSDASTSGSKAKPLKNRFVSRPDIVRPDIDVSGSASDAKRGSDPVFLTPKESGGSMRGPLIADASGEVVWSHPLGSRWSYDLRVQRYRGDPVLTWWRGKHFSGGYGEGEFVLMDNRYREVTTVTTPGVMADFHHMTLTSRGTALMTAFPIVPRDLTSIGGPKKGYVADCVVQEVDVRTGRTVFRWSALDHVPLSETMADPEGNPSEPGTKKAPLDPYHVNSVHEDGPDKLLVSARNTSAVYRIDKPSGKLDWTLGGPGSDMEMAGDSEFYYQHDAQRQPDGTITLFDNQGAPEMGEESRGLRLAVDPKKRTARVVQEYLPPDGRLSASQGNMQVRPNRNVFIGWGSELNYSEYTAGGKLLSDASISGQSYRAFRFPWVGRPTEPPAFVLKKRRAYVSWNGATEVAAWRFVAGRDPQSAKPVKTVERDGFETSTRLADRPYVGAQALDASGKVLATAEPGSWP